MNPAAPEQPLPYSHKKHVAMGLECTFCHVNPEPGTQMTFPATSICMTCHQNMGKTKPDLAKLAEYAKSGETIPWVRVYKLLPGPRWSHRNSSQSRSQMRKLSRAGFENGSHVGSHQRHDHVQLPELS